MSILLEEITEVIATPHPRSDWATPAKASLWARSEFSPQNPVGTGESTKMVPVPSWRGAGAKGPTEDQEEDPTEKGAEQKQTPAILLERPT